MRRDVLRGAKSVTQSGIDRRVGLRIILHVEDGSTGFCHDAILDPLQFGITTQQ